jgi:hypothetical protein
MLNDRLVHEVKDIFTHNFEEYHKMSEVVDKYLVPTNHEKKVNAEISTPESLRKDMLDALIKYGDPDFFKKPQRVLEPCAGKGGFLVSIIDRFMDGLKDLYPDPEERYKFIVENCIYYADINPTNIFICKLILDPMDKYNLHAYQGNTLDLDTLDKVKDVFKLPSIFQGFDAVIGNPPYNNSQVHTGKRGGGDLLWHKFVKYTLNLFLMKGGLVSFVHPSGWRKPEGGRSKYTGLFKMMCHDRQMMYLSIHGIKDGRCIFKCGTRYDWYVIKNKPSTTSTYVLSEYGGMYEVDMRSWKWLPNDQFDKIKHILRSGDVEACEVIYSNSSYESRRSHVNTTQSDIFKYPLVHSTPKSGTRYMYSSRNDLGHFGIPKLIFGETGLYQVILDLEGKYGMTQQAMGIAINSEDDVELLTRVLESDSVTDILKVCSWSNYTDILKACSWSNYMIDWRLFTYFKKDWYKEFGIE